MVPQAIGISLHNIAPHSQGTPHYGASMPPYTGQTGGGHYGQVHGGYGNQTYVNQNYQGAVHRPAHPRLPFLAMLNIPDLSRLMNDHVSHARLSLIIFPRTYLSSRENQERIRVNMLLHFTYGSLPIPYTNIQSV